MVEINHNNEKDLRNLKIHGRPQKTNELDDHPDVLGYNFENVFNFDDFISSYSSIGFQATNLSKAIHIIKAMRRDNAKIYLSFTSNIISSGLRDIITFLVKNKFVDVIVTSAGGVEEDIIKIKNSFKIGDFSAPPKALYDNGIFRTGNIFVPNSRYTYLELFLDPLLEKLYSNNKKIFSTNEFISELGLALEDEEGAESSYIYWAYKNNIPVFCPGIVDGSIGDIISFFKYNHKDFYIDTTGDVEKINNMTLQFDKTGVICIGGGLPKHFVLNANILREGADYAVYINTAQEFDGSDSGANIQEAQSWYKIKLSALSVKVCAEATLVFPILVAATFKKEYDSSKK